jgi:D-3-phosphoglycerate dehydrogenase
MSFKVVVTARSFLGTAGRHHELLEQAGCEVVPNPLDRPLKANELKELIADADGAILGLDECPAEVIQAAPKLRVISRYGVGIDKVDLKAATKAGVVVTVTPGTNHIAVAELTIGLLLALARRIPQHNSTAKQSSWKRITGIELADKNLGIVGLGKISREVIKRAYCFGMHMLVHTSYPDEQLCSQYGVRYGDLDWLLAESDFLSLHCALTSQQIRMISEPELRAMKPGSYLVNTARGELVDEEALAKALKEGWIAGAASDVLIKEPPDPSNPLLRLENFILIPHAGAATKESVLRMGILSVENALHVLKGERPYHVVNPEVYRGK